MPDPLTPEQRSLRAKLAAHAMHAKHDTRETTVAGRAKFDERFVDEVDPGRVLPEPERQRRASHARRAYFAKLALLSSQARSRKAGAA